MQSKSKMQVSKQKAAALLHIPDRPFLHLEIGKRRGTAAASKGAWRQGGLGITYPKIASNLDIPLALL